MVALNCSDPSGPTDHDTVQLVSVTAIPVAMIASAFIRLVYAVSNSVRDYLHFV